MTQLDRKEYYQFRERQERSLASKATSSNVATLHSDMAEHYATLLHKPVMVLPIR